jgi:mRNA interferase HigB
MLSFGLNVISRRGLSQLLAGKSADVATEVLAWYRVARTARWENLADVRRIYPSADQVGLALIFNIRHNRYRLIATVIYRKQKLYVKALLTHKQYDQREWMKWA